jgi:hypothetical protein
LFSSFSPTRAVLAFDKYRKREEALAVFNATFSRFRENQIPLLGWPTDWWLLSNDTDPKALYDSGIVNDRRILDKQIQITSVS